MVAVLGLGGAMFAVMRPSAGGGGSTPTTDAVARARGAVAASQQAAARAQAAAGQDARSTGQDAPAAGRAVTAPAPAPAPAKPAAPAGRDLSTPILRELAHGKVAVLLFWDRRGADDRATRSAVAHVDRHHGTVAVHVAPVSRVGDYGAITQGVEVLQSPTVLVIGPEHQARTIAGYTDTAEVDQLVDDVRAGR
jgi:hypothetical protein